MKYNYLLLLLLLLPMTSALYWSGSGGSGSSSIYNIFDQYLNTTNNVIFKSIHANENISSPLGYFKDELGYCGDYGITCANFNYNDFACNDLVYGCSYDYGTDICSGDFTCSNFNDDQTSCNAMADYGYCEYWTSTTIGSVETNNLTVGSASNKYSASTARAYIDSSSHDYGLEVSGGSGGMSGIYVHVPSGFGIDIETEDSSPAITGVSTSGYAVEVEGGAGSFKGFNSNVNGKNLDIEQYEPTGYNIYAIGGKNYIQGNVEINGTLNVTNGRNVSTNCISYRDGSIQCSASSGSGSSYNATYHATSADVSANRSLFLQTNLTNVVLTNQTNPNTRFTSINITGGEQYSNTESFSVAGSIGSIFRAVYQAAGQYCWLDKITCYYYQIGRPTESVVYSSGAGSPMNRTVFISKALQIFDTTIDLVPAPINRNKFELYTVDNGAYLLTVNATHTKIRNIQDVDIREPLVSNPFPLSAALSTPSAGNFTGMQLCEFWNGDAECWYGSDIRSTTTGNAGNYRNPVMQFYVQEANTYTLANRFNILNLSWRGAEFMSRDVMIEKNITVKNLIKLESMTLPACGTNVNGVIGRNSSGVYGCNSTHWVKLF